MGRNGAPAQESKSERASIARTPSEKRAVRAVAADAEGSLDGASAQSGTTRETLLKIYRQPKPAEKAALALQLDGLRRA